MIKAVTLPDYNSKEEAISYITHYLGAIFGFIATILMILKVEHNFIDIFAVSVFGLSMLILYMSSGTYHFVAPGHMKKIFRVFDHCSIYILIAGTYTPFCLMALGSGLGYGIAIGVWTVTFIGIAGTVINLEKFQKIGMICYLGVGWCIVMALKPLARILPTGGLILLIAGGVVYTLGAILYALGSKRKYLHSIWHFFVLAGTICHFAAIYFYVI